jgi:hypothetical protein
MPRCLAIGSILAVVAGGLLLALKALPYSTSVFSSVSPGGVLRPPAPDFELDGIRWPVSSWSRDPALGPFRHDFLEHCAGQQGLSAALCVSNRMARAFPNGEPRTEPFLAVFDPVAHLREHLEGSPGHCVTRSAILVAELLSVGIPARVVQILGPRGPTKSGHTVVEVWEHSRGWTVVDPTYGRVLRLNDREACAWTLVTHPHAVHWESEGVTPGGVVASGGRGPLAAATILYPEPWLYLRIGSHSAPWPFRGRFARAGKVHLLVGPLQTAIVATFLLCAAGAAACWLAWVSAWSYDRRSRREAKAAAAREIP